ncbi:MAG: hypothetical protein PSX79_01095 [bacterium]|nr:hypothetical protein [bacterium]
MSKSASRRDLAAIAAFSQRNGITFQYTAIPDDVETGGGLDFETTAMRRLFDHGVALGSSDHVWSILSANAVITVPPPKSSPSLTPGDRDPSLAPR